MSEYLDQVISTIEEAIKRKKTSAAKASTEAVGHFSFVRNMKIGKSPRLENVKKLCDVLDLELYIGFPEDYLGLTKATVLGTSSGETLLSQHNIAILDDTEHLSDCEQISAPTNKGSIVAFTIGDNALSPVFSRGDVIFADLADKSDPSQWEQFIGKICIVQLQDKETLLRILRRGDNPDTFNFESLIKEPTLTNQSPKICLPVCWISKL